MNTPQCGREHEVVEAVSSGRWPKRCDEELRSHVAACGICTDVADVAVAFQAEYGAAEQNVQVPSAGLVWWRAELRARREAMRTVERPMTVVHAFSGACAAGVVFAVLNQLSPWFRESMLKLMTMVPDQPVILLQQHLPLAVTLVALVVLAPVALYFVLSDK